MSSGADDERGASPGFLGRWSSRKRAPATAPASAPSRDDETDVPVADAHATDAVPGPESPHGYPPGSVPPGSGTGDVAPTIAADEDEPLLTDADMPPIESLDADSDLSKFFGRGVTASLRRAALRQVFRQPRYNVRDGLNDYDGDFTTFEPLGDTVTSDMKFHAARHERNRLEREREALAEREAAGERATGVEAGTDEHRSAEAASGEDRSSSEREASDTRDVASGRDAAVEPDAPGERGASDGQEAPVERDASGEPDERDKANRRDASDERHASGRDPEPPSTDIATAHDVTPHESAGTPGAPNV